MNKEIIKVNGWRHIYGNVKEWEWDYIGVIKLHLSVMRGLKELVIGVLSNLKICKKWLFNSWFVLLWNYSYEKYFIRLN